MQNARTLIALGAILAWPAPAPAAETDTAPSDIVAAGRERFRSECAICHGTEARGDGPFATLLTQQPPNLRYLSRRAGGEFPMDEVISTIDGRDMPLAHGTREMPLFGQVFGQQVPYQYETIIRGYILEIVMYLRSVQDP
jgi:mono/diheme cytochrome c family protein